MLLERYFKMPNSACKNCAFINGNIKWAIRGPVSIKTCTSHLSKRCIPKYIIKDTYNSNIEC